MGCTSSRMSALPVPPLSALSRLVTPSLMSSPRPCLVSSFGPLPGQRPRPLRREPCWPRLCCHLHLYAHFLMPFNIDMDATCTVFDGQIFEHCFAKSFVKQSP